MPLAVDLYRAESAHPPEPPQSGTGLEVPTDSGVGEIAAVLRLQPRHHLVVVGRDSLSLALDLWRAGFVHVGCAPRNLDCIAHGVVDALVAECSPEGPDLGRIIARSRFMLREGGWLAVRVPHAASRTFLPAITALLDQAGFAAGVGLFDAGGRWITAQRRRPALRLV